MVIANSDLLFHSFTLVIFESTKSTSFKEFLLQKNHLPVFTPLL
jgi:hypothetical protein